MPKDMTGFVLRGAQKTLSLSPTLLIEYSPHGLMNCGFSPYEFLDIVFANYHHVFVVHEIRMRACTKQDVLRLGMKEGLGANLLATNDEQPSGDREDDARRTPESRLAALSLGASVVLLARAPRPAPRRWLLGRVRLTP